MTSRVIKVNEGRTLGEVMDGGWATRQFDYGGPLTTLQDIHGRLAYQILYQRDKALPYSQNQIVQEATKIPQKAFEAYVKAVQLPCAKNCAPTISRTRCTTTPSRSAARFIRRRRSSSAVVT